MSTACPHLAILGMQVASNACASVTTEADCRAACYFAGAAMLAVAAKPAPLCMQPRGEDGQSRRRRALGRGQKLLV